MARQARHRLLGAGCRIPVRPLRHIRSASRHPRCSRPRGTHRERGRLEPLAAAPHRSDRPFVNRLLIGTLAVVALAGCGASKDEGISGGGKVIGRTVTVYSLTSDPGGSGRDFVDAEKLALADAGGRAGSFAVNFTSLDLGGSDEKLQAQASRRAISDPQIIAAIVDATKVTVPLFNAAGILQVAASGDPSLASDPQALPSGKHTVATLPTDPPPPDFEARFAKEFGRDPAPSAAAGYRAMKGVLQAIADAGAAGNDRTSVIDAYLGT